MHAPPSVQPACAGPAWWHHAIDMHDAAMRRWHGWVDGWVQTLTSSDKTMAQGAAMLRYFFTARGWPTSDLTSGRPAQARGTRGPGGGGG